MSRSPGPPWRYAWLWSSVWLVYLINPLVRAWQDPDPVHRAAALLTLLAFAATFTYAFARVRRLRAGDGAPPWLRRTVLAVAAALIAVGLFTIGEGALGMFVYLSVMTVFLVENRAALAGLVLMAGVAGALPWLVPHWREHADLSLPLQVLLAGMAAFGVVVVVRRNRQLADAREEIARLAVADERNRFARDLHDILGHSLTVVAVKAELAGRLVRLDPDRAEGEIADVEKLARRALADVRVAVTGYREVSLAGELANARTALFAAGIDADLPTAVDLVPGERRELFGWVLREGVTNVVRHSGAARCRVRMTPSSIEIVDDGRGPLAPGAPGTTGQGTAGTGSGNGLSGLRERVAAAGGSLTAGRSPDGGFLLRASVGDLK